MNYADKEGLQSFILIFFFYIFAQKECQSKILKSEVKKEIQCGENTEAVVRRSCSVKKVFLNIFVCLRGKH